ncbi:MAG: hypothetical protein DKM50_08390 [Candidatus Margulisiibacteriota bacterium]|nr:MAG: hypothetical protein A2X43_03170 [Candidatus Margulisbacteria bacterium GWD2_39_127]OGI05014.1 MAG: hypothetical protein A2X42_05435 [Candidatus Margulisbacteria bacterium GWF2_38_17]OGI09010.1 MAG: hypothetical protein A2X41_01630 [Candidatus Margulisbacteria bacterium GWE2_39_32]PZM79614.1 MAG: hypothetical protein DKM50_08390 [Candidatus Margulisiibacteriota bacterium]HAR63204.1 hypothetical protein [Candidatus Margulisiibacteriota bacterium]
MSFDQQEANARNQISSFYNIVVRQYNTMAQKKMEMVKIALKTTEIDSLSGKNICEWRLSL